MNAHTQASEQQNTLIVTLPSDFSGLSVDQYRDQFDDLVTTDKSTIVLDFGSTEFIDSSGIGAMVYLYKRIEKRGVQLLLLKVAGQPNKLMKLLRVDRTITFIDDLKSL
ncbi:STAS domain-containing protein [Pseudoalteromonas sp. C2R02]|uniref:STAS domain-containing protein n=1 Tax=Pseudoalteromonas sp. C2R02 TaxID=2841565 RepID=UPI001C087A78|nr:STAS domain-containing protein [Pseudoalteromonas sp. C2R02]MBU2971399.1 STAS domain-containing protein [Pseudoalteromonas sp. C2R02]